MTTTNGDESQYEREEKVLRQLEQEIWSDPRQMQRINNYRAMLQANASVSPGPSWGAMAAAFGILCLDAAFLAVSVATSSSGVMVLAFLLFFTVPIPFWYEDRRDRQNKWPGGS